MGGKSVEAANYAAINGIAYYDMTKGCPHAYVVTTVPATVFAKGKKISTCPRKRLSRFLHSKLQRKL